jgi:D-alanine-D-alanine ligase
MQRTTVLLLFGGESSEHDVSVSSARNVYAAIDDEKFDVLLGYIDNSGKWWLLDNFGMQIDSHGAPQLLPALGGGGFVTLPEQRVINPDVILPILHGKNGEDGSVQGLAQLLHIPIVGCDIAASAVGLDKLLTKQLLTAHSIGVVPYEVHHIYEAVPEFHKLSMTLGSPLFVKPARGGSSVGVSKVYSEEELVGALEVAHGYDDMVLIEQAITGRELEVAVLGSIPTHQVSTVGEVVTGADFYSYDDKYTDGTSSVAIPAALDSHLISRIQALASRIYEIIGCQGLSRIDFFLSEDGSLYLNEINTLPGFTNISMYPKLWKHEGMSYAEIIERLITDALRYATIKPTETEEK